MFGGEGVERIAGYFREPLAHKPLGALEDVKRFPNDILISYILAELNFGKDSLAEVFGDMRSFEHWLEIAEEDLAALAQKHAPLAGAEMGADALGEWQSGHVQELVAAGELPELPQGYSYAGPLELIANAITHHSTGYFAFGEGKKGREGKLLAALQENCTHEYPSGKTVPYTNLCQEVPANLSIMEAGYSTTNKEGAFKIYVRQNSIVMLAALFGALKETPEFREYMHLDAGRFEHEAAGIVVAHELGEIEAARGMHVPDDPLERDRAAERYAKQFLEENGVQLLHYKLFHRLRVDPGDSSRSVSADVLKEL